MSKELRREDLTAEMLENVEELEGSFLPYKFIKAEKNKLTDGMLLENAYMQDYGGNILLLQQQISTGSGKEEIIPCKDGSPAIDYVFLTGLNSDIALTIALDAIVEQNGHTVTEKFKQDRAKAYVKRFIEIRPELQIDVDALTFNADGDILFSGRYTGETMTKEGGITGYRVEFCNDKYLPPAIAGTIYYSPEAKPTGTKCLIPIPPKDFCEMAAFMDSIGAA